MNPTNPMRMTTTTLQVGMRVWPPVKSAITPMVITHISEPKREARDMFSRLVSGVFDNGEEFVVQAFQDARWTLDT